MLLVLLKSQKCHKLSFTKPYSLSSERKILMCPKIHTWRPRKCLVHLSVETCRPCCQPQPAQRRDARPQHLRFKGGFCDLWWGQKKPQVVPLGSGRAVLSPPVLKKRVDLKTAMQQDWATPAQQAASPQGPFFGSQPQRTRGGSQFSAVKEVSQDI